MSASSPSPSSSPARAPNAVLETDYLVIGSGLAGLGFALSAAHHGRVMIVTKRGPADSNTSYAQGGVAAVLDPTDDTDAHIADTLKVGDGLCHVDVVERCVREAPAHIQRFADEIGVPFDRDDQGDFVLG
ncbi:MAG TPA: FAD-dependent oxidoreductase, partial [Polyangia bacterium]|nr:FAD-dependent oxidoreductase [Polyangia bacterium]